MVRSPFTQNSALFQERAVRVLLRGKRVLEGKIHIPEGQVLMTFLGMRTHFLNLTSVRWKDEPEDAEPMAHLSLRTSNIVWVVPLEQGLHVSAEPGPGMADRRVQLHLVDGWSLDVTLNISGEQRMSDYFDSNVAFIPLMNAEILSSGAVVERLAVNHTALLAIREI
jgi:hypothetical protein